MKDIGHPPPVERGEFDERLGQHDTRLVPRQRVGQDGSKVTGCWLAIQGQVLSVFVALMILLRVLAGILCMSVH